MNGYEPVLAMLLLFSGVATFGFYTLWEKKKAERKLELEEQEEKERIASCTHPKGFTVVKIFGHPDLRKCRTCDRIFEMTGEEVDQDYFENFIEDTDRWIKSSDGGNEIRIWLPRSTFRKLYELSAKKQKTMDDVIIEMIENYGKG